MAAMDNRADSGATQSQARSFSLAHAHEFSSAARTPTRLVEENTQKAA